MNKDTPQTPQTWQSAVLRHHAEKQLKSQTPEAAGARPRNGRRTPAKKAAVAGLATAAPEDQLLPTRRLVHELQVHQIELEMQNDQLRESRAQVEAALERYTNLYDFAPVGYFTLSVDGAIREVNLPGARLLGLERARLVGDRFGAFVSEGTRPIFDSWLKKVFTTETKQVCEVTLVKKGRTPMIVEIEAAISTDGREGRAVVVDITARKILEEQLQQARKMEVVGQLAGGVAHDFNNIVAAMLLNLEIMRQRRRLPEDVQSPLRNVEALAKRAGSLTRQLLLFSRRQAMHPEQLEMNAALTHLLKMLKRLLGEDITCLHLPSARELWVEADATMLDQIGMNLCLNARDAMPNGGTLTLETSLAEFDAESAQVHPEARPGRFVCLRVSDTGRGMDVDVLKHLFEPFFTTKEVGKGSGLGLASAYGIVHQHQGWVNVESVVGRGTTFRVYLPLLAKPKTAPASIPDVLPPKGQNETILLVEDEIAVRSVCAEVLTLLGYQVLSAAEGQEALKLWEQHRDAIDLVLTDMRMPKSISGLDLAEKLLKSKPSLKIIIMSGYNMEMVQNSAAGHIGYTFLAKPFEFKTLAETVRHCLD